MWKKLKLISVHTFRAFFIINGFDWLTTLLKFYYRKRCRLEVRFYFSRTKVLIVGEHQYLSLSHDSVITNTSPVWVSLSRRVSHTFLQIFSQTLIKSLIFLSIPALPRVIRQASIWPHGSNFIRWNRATKKKTAPEIGIKTLLCIHNFNLGILLLTLSF